MKKAPTKFDTKSPLFSKAAVREAFLRDGAVILTNLEPTANAADSDDAPWRDVAASVPLYVWDRHDLLLQDGHRADAVHHEHAKINLSGEALHPHSDGYIWGDKFPDVVILVCEEPAGTNQQGSNYLMDGYNIVARLDKETRQFLENKLVDHTERSETSFVNGAISVVPVIRYLQAKGWGQTELAKESGASMASSSSSLGEGRLCWRRMVNQSFGGKKVKDEKTGDILYASLWAPVEGESSVDEVNKALLEMDRAISAEEDEALRFALGKGESLIVDNYRMLHAREAFHGLDQKRRMWRVWSWSNASFGLPPQIAAISLNEDKSDVPCNIHDAQKSIQAEA